MIGLIMAGGKGTRMDSKSEKLLLKYKKPIILHVVDSLRNSNCFSKILAITSPNSPNTKQLLTENNIEIFETSGNGYVEDLNIVLTSIKDDVFITSGDLPLLDESIVRTMVKQYQSSNDWTSFLVTQKFLNTIKYTPSCFVNYKNEKCCFTGISLVNSRNINDLESIPESFIILDDKRIALNLNTKQDVESLRTA